MTGRPRLTAEERKRRKAVATLQGARDAFAALRAGNALLSTLVAADQARRGLATVAVLIEACRCCE